MKRLKSIDTFRGLSMLWMFVGHLQNWWLRDSDLWLYNLSFTIVDPIGSSAFIFIAGLTAVLSVRQRFIKAQLNDEYKPQMIKREYFFRALLIFLLAIMYNISIAAALLNPLWIWTWFVLLTVSISLILGWFLMKLPIWIRIAIGFIIWILNQVLLFFLFPYQNQLNVYGIMFHILYHSRDLDVILTFFPFFLFGTVIGEILFKIYRIKDEEDLKRTIKKRFIYPTLISGLFLIFVGIVIFYPNFLINRSFSWTIYTLGIDLTLFSILFIFEEFKVLKLKRSYHFLFFYSFYSLTIYFIHNVLYFLFYKQLNTINIWIYILITVSLMGLLFKILYNKFGSKISIKVQIGKLAFYFAKKGKQFN
ncbi:MAG: heparan-alpha-glucosaminide N-acetyltransferase domain-containing protein [Candidatus Heimdallarchaeota archaeon]